MVWLEEDSQAAFPKYELDGSNNFNGKREFLDKQHTLHRPLTSESRTIQI